MHLKINTLVWSARLSVVLDPHGQLYFKGFFLFVFLFYIVFKKASPGKP